MGVGTTNIDNGKKGVRGLYIKATHKRFSGGEIRQNQPIKWESEFGLCRVLCGVFKNTLIKYKNINSL